ncbi:cutinase family protein [Mycobacterium sp.]|uniref:cutinase family protein n=1 Tax=Mycobacterium sp. TaxID=1785 RepID=UPI003D09CC08
MTRRSFARGIAIAPLLVLTSAHAPAVTPVASADGCPDAEVVFARGTGEPVGPGGPGQAFFDSLTNQLPGKAITLYPLDYPSTTDYISSAKTGAATEVAHVQATAANCPKTKIVIGGYSQGAGVADLTSHQLSPQVANHVAAVALFGNPQSNYAKGLADNQVPPLDPAWASKTIDICLPNDNICAEGGNIIAHLGYVPDATNQAATFVAGRL